MCSLSGITGTLDRKLDLTAGICIMIMHLDPLEFESFYDEQNY